ncbi:MAG: hypothetical protein E5W75_22610 [Mesorhizobium sp.]|nr:MAG: hypothetical protein E5W75_22610 [Mesorhizobium sp.]
MPASTDLDLATANDTAKHAARHPCCAGPELADFAAPATPRHSQATPNRNDATTGKGEDQ